MAERPVVWISHRAGERCAGCAAEGDWMEFPEPVIEKAEVSVLLLL
jgi:hypothetical protein